MAGQKGSPSSASMNYPSPKSSAETLVPQIYNKFEGVNIDSGDIPVAMEKKWKGLSSKSP